MFGKRKSGDPGGGASDTAAERRAADALARARKERISAAHKGGAPGAADAPRRAGGFSLPGARGAGPALPGESRTGQSRTLVVGRDISLSGEIKACETLIVEGRVEADLTDCQVLQISPAGLYKGTAAVEEADISGRFDGDLTVSGTLILRATGRVSGRLRYVDMEIERGGKLSGKLEDIAPSDTAESNAKPASDSTKPASGPAPVRRAKARAARASESSTA